MDFGWTNVLLVALVVGTGVAALFVSGSYLLATTLHRGQCAWPSLGCLIRETLWVSITQPLLFVGWMGPALRSTPRSGWQRRQPAASESNAPPLRPVILVHGYTQSRTNFIWLARALGRRGLGPFFGFNYFSFGRVEHSAHRLKDFIEKVIERTGAEDVDLVCHSMGGLVARACVDLLGHDRHVRSVVTLGTPHRGVMHARLGFGAGVLDLHPSTGFIRRLDEAPPSPKVSYTSIFSEHDNIVFPHTVASLGGRGRDQIVRGHGHFGILFSEEVAEHVYEALAGRAVMRASSP